MSAHIASMITRAISSGFTARTILNHITRQFPQFANVIANASAAGYAADKILKHLVNPKGKNPDDDSYLTDSEKTDKADKARKRKAALGLGAAGLAAIGGVAGLGMAAGRGAAVHASQILPALAQQAQLPGSGAPAQIGNIAPLPQGPPTPTAPTGPTPTPSPMNMTPGQQINSGAGQTNPNQMAQAAQAMPQQANEITQENLDNDLQYQPEYDLLQKNNLIPKIQTLMKSGKSKSEIIEFVKKRLPIGDQEKLRRMGDPKLNLDQKFERLINRFFPQDNANQEKISPKMDETQAFQPEIEPEKPQKIEKGSEVLTPNGMGKVKAEDSKGLIVESNGKAHRISHEEAISSPLPEKDIAELYTELVNKIPESDRSSMINIAGYDPNHNEFIFMPHDGALYVYKDIPQEFAKKIQDALFQAKTTGSNFYGAWSQGEESRGAGLSALIKELQKLYGGKGKEYVRKYEKVYDFFALPKAAVKAKEKKEREERKKRK